MNNNNKLRKLSPSPYWSRYIINPHSDEWDSIAKPQPSVNQSLTRRKSYANPNMTAIFIKCGKTEYGPLRTPREIALAIDEITSNPPQDARWPELLSLIAQVNQEQNFFIAADNVEFYFSVQKRNC